MSAIRRKVENRRRVCEASSGQKINEVKVTSHLNNSR